MRQNQHAQSQTPVGHCLAGCAVMVKYGQRNIWFGMTIPESPVLFLLTALLLLLRYTLRITFNWPLKGRWAAWSTHIQTYWLSWKKQKALLDFLSTVPVSWFFFPGWCMFLLAHCFRFLFLFPASDIIISLSKQLSNNWHSTYRPSRYVITPLGFHFDFSYKLVKFHDFILHALCDLSRSESKKTARSAGSSSQTWNNPGLETFLAEGLCWVWANKQT